MENEIAETAAELWVCVRTFYFNCNSRQPEKLARMAAM